MAATLTTNFSLSKPAVGDVGWGNLVNGNWDTLDTAIQVNKDGLAAVSAGSAVPRPLTFRCAGDEDPGTHIHFQVQVSAFPAFTTILIDKESRSDQANWFYDNTSGEFTQIPSGGIVADYEWVQNDKGVWLLEAANFTKTMILYRVPATETALSPGTLYYWRYRQYDVEGAVNGAWSLDSFRG